MLVSDFASVTDGPQKHSRVVRLQVKMFGPGGPPEMGRDGGKGKKEPGTGN